ncbi:LysR family transcriptional regulator [Bradyrhizobium sp. WSM 1704]|uniref:LysR family transcriptional regulator n=1 Tax=Bradyrhizobium semiaridum TaxID=2821404 RepID=UPI001CE2BDDB|nr:LysR family transcriptional regulator [Bradyrhizobium semiaridum]MCA6123684.1 LysR family transcriptional regulator [Bradyrhizobium semiaridum]
MQSALDWNDLRLVLAIAREESLSGAARRLGVTHSTVFRRLGAIEAAIGTRLFERFRDGYSPTPAGEMAAISAARLEDEVLALERKLSGQDLRPSGVVRITTTDTLGVVLMRHLPAMRAAHPEIQPEIVISNTMANLTRREAEIAIRPTPAPSELLIGRRIAEIAHAVYGSRSYLARRDRKELTAHDWIGLDDALAGTVIAGWMRANLHAARIACRVDALPALRDAAAAGLGLALLPCYVGDLVPQLRRLTPKALAEPRSALWLLTHDDLKRTARIRATLDFLARALASERALFEGKRAAAR